MREVSGRMKLSNCFTAVVFSRGGFQTPFPAACAARLRSTAMKNPSTITPLTTPAMMASSMIAGISFRAGSCA